MNEENEENKVSTFNTVFGVNGVSCDCEVTSLPLTVDLDEAALQSKTQPPNDMKHDQRCVCVELEVGSSAEWCVEI